MEQPASNHLNYLPIILVYSKKVNELYIAKVSSNKNNFL